MATPFFGGLSTWKGEAFVNKTILLVDENLELMEKIGIFLEDFGYVAQTAPSRHEALGKVRAFDPGLVICRLTLADGDAFMFAEELRRFYQSHAPLLVMASAKEIEHYRRRPSEAKSVQHWIRWPVDNMELFNAVQEWLGREMSDGLETPVPSPKTGTVAPPQRPRPDAALKHATQRPAAPARRKAAAAESEIVGNLKRTAVCRLLWRLASRRETGVLTFNHPPAKMVIHFQGGRIVNVDSNYIPDLSLGMLMAKNGKLSPRELAGARKRWEREGGLFGKTLLDLQLVEAEHLSLNLAEQKIKKVISLFDWQWRSGTFAFRRDADAVKPAEGFQMRVESLLFEGVRCCYDRARLMESLGKNNRMLTPYKLNVGELQKLAGAASGGALQNTIDALRTAQSITQAMTVCGIDETRFLQFVYVLFVMDALEFKT